MTEAPFDFDATPPRETNIAKPPEPVACGYCNHVHRDPDSTEKKCFRAFRVRSAIDKFMVESRIRRCQCTGLPPEPPPAPLDVGTVVWSTQGGLTCWHAFAGPMPEELYGPDGYFDEQAAVCGSVRRHRALYPNAPQWIEMPWHESPPRRCRRCASLVVKKSSLIEEEKLECLPV